MPASPVLRLSAFGAVMDIDGADPTARLA